MCRKDFLEEYDAIAKETGAQIQVFPIGNHPALLSNAERAAEAIGRFLKQYELREGMEHMDVPSFLRLQEKQNSNIDIQWFGAMFR